VEEGNDRLDPERHAVVRVAGRFGEFGGLEHGVSMRRAEFTAVSRAGRRVTDETPEKGVRTLFLKKGSGPFFW